LIKSFAGYDENVLSEIRTKEGKEGAESFFAKRLTTGLAAERYFEAAQPNLSEFREYAVENTTRLGCGYDFRLRAGTQKDFLAVEVKGLKDRTGGLSLTPKEYETATTLTDRFFLFVVKNFRESPFHEIYKNPLSGMLRFKRKETVVVSISWLTSV
jgi:uncharacterized protein DUF3883